jgi:hypothetical protein
MTNDDFRDAELSEAEAEALGALRRDRQPPAGVEARVMQVAGFTGSAARDAAARPVFRSRWAAGILAALAGSLIFAAGFSIGRGTGAPSETAARGPRFMLLLYEDGTYQRAADPQARVREYADWARSLARAGQLVAGDELDAGGLELNPHASPVPRAADALDPRGYFVIVAADADAAARVAATCPHLRYGGRVVVRRLVT